jgi:phage repressor protein C with HTH and peptisase S24 domain
MELKDRVKYARKRASLTQAELADRVGIKQASVSELERGLSRTSGHLVKIAQICDVSALWLAEGIGQATGAEDASAPAISPTASAAEMVKQMLARQGKNLSEAARQSLLAVAEGEDAGGGLITDAYKPGIGKVGDEVWIAHYDIRGAMGGGEVNHDYPEMLQDVRVSPSQLRAMGVEFKEHYHLKMVTGWGQSMAPTIKHGDPLLVDISIKDFIGDGVYFFSYQGFQYIKRLQMKGKDKFKMISDNRKHKTEDIYVDETYIQARVLLVWNANLM